MIAKVILGTMNNARKLVSIVEKIPYDAELCSGRYVVNAKSMLGVLSMPEFEVGELHIHTDEEIAHPYSRQCMAIAAAPLAGTRLCTLLPRFLWSHGLIWSSAHNTGHTSAYFR